MNVRKITYFLVTIILLLFTNEISAQLFVKTGSFIFNKASSVYVKGNIQLDGTSNFYLRNEGQLLQGTTSTSTNTGTGKISVFQEGTVNNYCYNYWCSPVGGATALTSGNEPFGITMFNVPTGDSGHIISNSAGTTFSTYNGTSSTEALTIAAYWIYTYHIPSTNYININDGNGGWTQSGNTSNISAGRGFSMKGVSGDDLTYAGETTYNNASTGSDKDNQRYDFRGKPNDGDITIDVKRDKYTLTGNPYPSAIDLNLFFDGNPNLDGKAYYWEQDKTIASHSIAAYSGGYSTYNFANADVSANPDSGGSTSGYIYTAAVFVNYDLAGNPINVPAPPSGTYVNKGRFAPIGQGFMVKGASILPVNTTVTATMKNSYRVFVKEGSANESVFQKSGNATTSSDFDFYDDILNVAGIDYTQISKAPPPHIKINSTLNSSAVRQVAIGFRSNSLDGVDRADAKSPDTQSNLPIDVYMVLNNEEYVHSVTSFDINKRFPIGFKNNGQTVATYKIQVAEFVNFDAAEDVYLYDGLTNNYYNIKNNYYELTLAPGVYNNRFEITFLNTTLGLDDNLSSNFVIVQNNSNQLLSIANPNLLDVKSVILYDILGKSIFDKVNLGANSSYEFSTSSLSEGVYVVKLITADNKSLGQKIIVRKSN